MAVDWKEKVALLWQGQVRIRAGLQPYPPPDVRNPAVPEKKGEPEKGGESDDG